MSKHKISLNQLLSSLFFSPIPTRLEEHNASANKRKSLSLDDETNYFFEQHRKKLGISMQDMLELSLRALAQSTTSPTKTAFTLAVDRFKHLFEAHNIPQIHAKPIIDAGCDNTNFPLGGMTNDEILLENYSPSVKQTLSELFGVELDWLSGNSEHAIIPEPIFSRDIAYNVCTDLRHPKQLRNIQTASQDLILVTSDRCIYSAQDNNRHLMEVLLFRQTEYSFARYVKFKTFHLCGFFSLANEEARIGLQALLLHAQHSESISIKPLVFSNESVSLLKRGQLPATAFQVSLPSDWHIDTFLPQPSNDAIELSEKLSSI